MVSHAPHNTGAAASPETVPVSIAGLCLGFAAAGFFDGILLHQVLQWHHLLSNLTGGAFGDPAVQILADGLFHVVMYGVAGVGLWLLWRGPRSRRFWPDFLIGFGVWHMLDGVLVHWILKLHNIRPDGTIPLFWDLAFFALGVMAAALGLLLARRSGRPPGNALVLGVTLFILTAGGWALRPPPGDGVVALFRPGVEPPAIFAALQKLDGAVVWTSPDARLWFIMLEDRRRATALYKAGALWVGGGGAAFGCFAASPSP